MATALCLILKKMQDQLMELARHIARQEFLMLPTRNPLWVSSSMDIFELRNCHGTSHLPVQRIQTSKDETPPDFPFPEVNVSICFLLEVPTDLSYVLGSWDLSKDLVWYGFSCTISSSGLQVLHLTFVYKN